MKLLFLIVAVILLALQVISAPEPKAKRLCQIFCPDIEAPVCAKRGNVKKIFPNECRLNAANLCGEGEKWTKC